MLIIALFQGASFFFNLLKQCIFQLRIQGLPFHLITVLNVSLRAGMLSSLGGLGAGGAVKSIEE